MSIVCSHLTKTFGKKKALQDVSVKIADGKVEVHGSHTVDAWLGEF